MYTHADDLLWWQLTTSDTIFPKKQINNNLSRTKKNKYNNSDLSLATSCQATATTAYLL